MDAVPLGQGGNPERPGILLVEPREPAHGEDHLLVHEHLALVASHARRAQDGVAGAQLQSLPLDFGRDRLCLRQQLHVAANPSAFPVPDVAEACRHVTGGLVDDERSPSLPPHDQPVALEAVERLAHRAGAHAELAR